MPKPIDIVRDLITQFPDAPAKTLARMAIRDNPDLWHSLEACRSTVRKALGTNGITSRKYNSRKDLIRASRKAGWTGVIPEVIEQIDWKSFSISGANRTLILSDIHIPFHDKEALEVALDYGAKRKPTCIILNGDIADHYSLSKWETDPKLRDFPGEVKSVRFFLRGLRKRFKTAKIYLKLGNHEERFQRYMMMKCPELLGIPDFEWQEVFGLDEYDVTLVDQKRPIRLGQLNIIHGHEYSFPISNPVNPARGLFLRAKVHSVCGHFHMVSQHSEKNLEQKVVTTWSTGCLCNLHPAYRPLNAWGHGAAFVETGKDGAFHVDNFRIINGKAW